MIIFRYLCRELLTTTFAVCVVLLLILISGRFVKYLAKAVSGYMDPGVIFAIIGYRVPGFLELTLPLAFFLAILLTYGRLYVESEMSVLKACGVSEGNLLKYTFAVALLIAVLVGWLSLAVTPSGATKYLRLLDAQSQRSELDKLQPKSFYPMQGGNGVIYADSIDVNQNLGDVFLVVAPDEEDASQQGAVVVVAEQGEQKLSVGDQRALVLTHGYRIEGKPGNAAYQVTQFGEYGARLAPPQDDFEVQETDALSTTALMRSTDLGHAAALQWRLSVPMLVLVVTLFAVPLSRTNPRQGRFTKLLPAVLLYFIYLIALNMSRDAIEAGKLPLAVGLIPVHAIFLVVALLLISSGKPKRAKAVAKSATDSGAV